MSRDGSLPPGVTGNEYQIAGPDWEGDIEVQCDGDGFNTMTVTGYHESNLLAALDRIRKVHEEVRNLPYNDDERLERVDVIEALRGLYAVTAFINNAQGDVMDTGEVDKPCPFEGTVTAEIYQGMRTWVCPLCRRTHEDEVE